MMLAACGGVTAPAVDEAGVVDLSDAIAATRAARSARVQMTMETASSMGSFDITGDGVVALDGSRASFVMGSTGALADAMVGEIRIVDGTQYISGGLVQQYVATGQAPAGAAWIAMPVPEFATAMPSPTMPDVAAQLELLRTADADIEELPDADIDGITHHHVQARLTMRDQIAALDISLDDVFANQPAAGTLTDEAGMSDFLEAADAVGYHYDVYYADDGLVRRIVMEVDLTPMFAAFAGAMPPNRDADADVAVDMTMTLTLDLTDYGVAVDVEAPTGNVHHVG